MHMYICMFITNVILRFTCEVTLVSLLESLKFFPRNSDSCTFIFCPGVPHSDVHVLPRGMCIVISRFRRILTI